MAVFVKTLAVTAVSCKNTTIGHVGGEKIHLLNNWLVNVNGIQNKAMIKSANARLSKNGRISVLHFFPFVNTTIVKTFPIMASSVVIEYKTINIPAAPGDKDKAVIWPSPVVFSGLLSETVLPSRPISVILDEFVNP